MIVNINAMRVYIMGFMGSGKTYWGSQWADYHKMSFIDLDKQMEVAEGITIEEIFTQKGEHYFRSLEAATLRSTAQLENAIIACGGGTPCYENNIDWIKENGTAVFIDATPEVLMNNLLEEKNKRPLIKHLNADELLPFIKDKIAERNFYYQQANLLLPYSALTVHSLENLISS